jgi:hypothetical protein
VRAARAGNPSDLCTQLTNMSDLGAPWFFSSDVRPPAGPRAPPGASCSICNRSDMHLSLGPAGSVHCWPVPVNGWAAAATFPVSQFGEHGLSAFVAIYALPPNDQDGGDGADPSPGPSPGDNSGHPINLD